MPSGAGRIGRTKNGMRRSGTRYSAARCRNTCRMKQGFMEHNFYSAFVVLLLVLDPLGNLPSVLSLLKAVPPERRRRLIAFECLIAFVVLLLIMLTGRSFLNLMHLSERSLEVAGGVILFMVAIRMVFPVPSGIFGNLGKGAPENFPLAVPLIAGPSAKATVLQQASQQPKLMHE